MNVDPTATARATATAPRPAPPAGAAAKGGFEDALRSALVSRSDAPPAAGSGCPDDGTRLSHRGPLSERAQRVQDMGAARRERLGLTAPAPEAGGRAEVRSPEQLTAELEAATAEGRTVRVSKAEYEALLAYNHDNLGPLQGGWAAKLGLAPSDLAAGGRSRTVNYGGVLGQRNAVPGARDVQQHDEVPAYLRGPDGGAVTVSRSAPTYYNTGGGRYLPPEVSNSPDHHLSRMPGALAGPQLRDRG